MLNGLYRAAAAMDAAQARHETAAGNLAAVQQPGYRRTHLSRDAFQAELLAARLAAEGNAAAAGAPAEVYDFRPGSIEATGRSLDVALQGDGFFVVDGPLGPLYTRSGRFHVADGGQLVTGDGLPVRGTGGAVTLPRGTNVEALEIAADGRILAQGQTLGRLEIVAFDDPAQLQRAGRTLFAANGAETRPTAATVAQGMLEGSNVSAMSELVELIAASRQYEAAQQALRAINDSTQRHINQR